jgi:hypothetical protein
MKPELRTKSVGTKVSEAELRVRSDHIHSCSRICSCHSTQNPQGSTRIGSYNLNSSLKSTYFQQISASLHKRPDLFWEQRAGGSNPSAPTIPFQCFKCPDRIYKTTFCFWDRCSSVRRRGFIELSLHNECTHCCKIIHYERLSNALNPVHAFERLSVHGISARAKINARFPPPHSTVPKNVYGDSKLATAGASV